MTMTQIRAEQLKGVAKQFPPFFTEIIPNFSTPNTQFEVAINGEFFTPDMIVTGTGFTVNSFIFIDTKKIKIFITSSVTDGNYAITLNNGSGTLITKTNVFTVSQGNVILPTLNDWTFVTGMNTADLNTPGEVKITQNNQLGVVRWNQVFDMTRKWRFIFSLGVSPFNSELTNFPALTFINLLNVADSSLYMTIFNASSLSADVRAKNTLNGIGINGGNGFLPSVIALNNNINSQNNAFYTLEWDMTVLRWYNENNLITKTQNLSVFPVPTGNLKLEVSAQQFNIDSIKYIELF